MTKLASSVAVLGLAILVLLAAPMHGVASARLGHHGRGQGHHADGRGHHRRANTTAFYVFGDDFADNGNLPRHDDSWPALSRQWQYPYGGSGRFSNSKVQPDFLAVMLGHSQAPPAHAVRSHHAGSRTGINFAVGGSGVFDLPQEVPTLASQVETFSSLVHGGRIKRTRLQANSVALVAVSGHDYDLVSVDTAAFADLAKLVDSVTSRIAATTARLQEIGVERILVNNLYPLGCSPSMCRPTNYTYCDELANQLASLHNRYLARKLASMEKVLLLDVNSAFNAILKHHGDGGGEVAQLFMHKLTPCCESLSPGGFCGMRSADDTLELYTLCEDAEQYFFWDQMNPTQAGWAAVMAELKTAIVDFLAVE